MGERERIETYADSAGLEYLREREDGDIFRFSGIRIFGRERGWRHIQIQRD